MRRLKGFFIAAGTVGLALVAGAVLLSPSPPDRASHASAAPRPARPAPAVPSTATQQRARPRPSVVEPPAGGSAAPQRTETAARQPAPASPESEPPGSPATLPQPDRSVYVQGDSLAVDTDPYLRGRLRGWTVETSAEIGRGNAAQTLLAYDLDVGRQVRGVELLVDVLNRSPADLYPDGQRVSLSIDNSTLCEVA